MGRLHTARASPRTHRHCPRVQTITVTDDDVAIWTTWSGALPKEKVCASGAELRTPKPRSAQGQLRDRLNTVVTYAEGARPECKNRLRMVTKVCALARKASCHGWRLT